MQKKLVLALIFVSVCASAVCAKTRQQVVSDATAHETIASWTASTNTHVFAADMIFRTQYSTGVVYASNNWPYVYGGREDDATTASRINGGTSPGGAPRPGSPNTKAVYDWWANDQAHRAQPAQYLAGIDCNGFVMRMLGVTSAEMLANTNAVGFKNYSVSVDEADLKLGDLLITDGHIKMVTVLSPFTVTEAIGGDIGRVVTRETEVNGYLPYSAFPIFTALSPSSGTIISEARPEIKARILTGTAIDIGNVVMKIDGTAVLPTLTSGTKYADVSYTPTENLSDGNHKVYIWAKNDLDLEDEIEAVFTLSTPFAVYDADKGDIISDESYVAVNGVKVTGPSATTTIILSGASEYSAPFAAGDTKVAEFSDLYDGDYTISAYNGDALLSSSTFTNDRTTPWGYITDENGSSIDVSTTATTIFVNCGDDRSGIDRVVLDGPTGSTRPFSGGPTEEFPVRFSGLSVGAYTAKIYDRSGNAEERAFWITTPPPAPYGEPPYIMESSGTIPFQGIPKFIRTAPDGSNYIAGDSFIIKITSGVIAWSRSLDPTIVSGLEIDNSGNAYLRTSDNLYRYPAGGDNPTSINLGGACVMAGMTPSTLALNRTTGRLYTVECDGFAWEVSMRVAAFDTNLNSLGYAIASSTEMGQLGGSAQFGGIFADEAGYIWLDSVELPYYADTSFQVRHFDPYFNSATILSQIAPSGYSLEDYHSVAVDPRGGMALIVRDTLWHVTAGGFASPSTARIENYAPMMAMDNGGNLYGWQGEGVSGIIKISTDNALVWNTPISIDNGNVAAIAITESGKLDVAAYDDNNIYISRYVAPLQFTSPDGQATLNSVTAEATVDAASPEIQSAASAAAESTGLLAVTTFYQVATGSSDLSLPATITLTYSTATLSAMGIFPEDIAVYEYDAVNGWIDIEDSTLDEVSSKISAKIWSSARVFAILFHPWDSVPPVAQLSVKGSPLADAATAYINETDSITITAEDFGINGSISEVMSIQYSTDVAFSYDTSDTALIYSIPFTLPVGTHTVYYSAIDNNWNQGDVKTAFITVGSPAEYSATLTVSSGPIGVPFTITGEGFGTYSSGITTVLVGGATAPLSLWSTDTIKGTIPGSLAAGEHAVAVMRGTTTIANAAPFTVTTPALYALTPSSGAIGVPFVITGESFGNYVANNTRVLIGGTTAPLSLWTDTRIQGTIPGSLAAGDNAVVVEREFNGNMVRTSSATFTVITPVVAEVTPSSGAIGVPFTITGANFGNYVANYTKVLIGGTTAPLSLWMDTKIQGTIPGSLAAGDYELVVQRELNGGITATVPAQFKVVTPILLAIIPSSGSIGVGFTLTGSDFGNYVANYTRVLIGGATAPLTLWSDGLIKGTVPGSLVSGTYDVAVERELNGGLVRTSTVAFTLVAPTIAAIAPSSGAIGVPFVITGANFGNYVANYARVLIGGTTAPLSLWSDTIIKGTIPGGLTGGDNEVVVERALNGGVVRTSTFTFTVITPELAGVTPSSGPIGMPFVINGANFGNYVANYTKVLIGGATAPLSLWSDTKIQGTIPGSLAAGDYELVVVRNLNGGEVRTTTAAYTVTLPVINVVNPSTAAVMAPFTISGASFGNYVANSTKVLINGATAQLTVWTDTYIKGKLPFLLNGTYPVQVQRSLNGGLAESGTAYITVVEPVISSMTPTSGAVGTVFNLFGTGFGPYDASQTRVTVGGVACTLSLWNDTNIRGTVPAGLTVGTYTVVAMRGQALANTIEYTVPGAVKTSMLGPNSTLAAEFKLGEVYVYPNPAKAGKVPVFHVEVGQADSVKIRIFTVTGQSVHEHTITGVPQAIDGTYAYEYAWEGRITSGVYFYTMEAERAGKKLKAKGKFAVVR